ncbi:NADH:ubiquinone reductase (Na(+)-transporting) subunit D [Aureispira]|nr:NADH:ubiquinone reductase (Na(+)-transporting) subunit D [Aureispira sp.]
MADTTVQTKKQSGLLGKEDMKLLKDPLHSDNPITIQVLGICSALAVTGSVTKSLVMAVALIFVCAFASLIISILRNSIPNSIRMIVQLLVIAGLVQIVEIVLGAFAYTAYVELSVFIGLIITNCIVMGRLEAFAMGNNPKRALLDGIGNGLGYGWILVAMAVVRELFGKGTFMGWEIMNPLFALVGGEYTLNNLMVLPASSLFVIGIFIWVQRNVDEELVDKS